MLSVSVLGYRRSKHVHSEHSHGLRIDHCVRDQALAIDCNAQSGSPLIYSPSFLSRYCVALHIVRLVGLVPPARLSVVSFASAVFLYAFEIGMLVAWVIGSHWVFLQLSFPNLLV